MIRAKPQKGNEDHPAQKSTDEPATATFWSWVANRVIRYPAFTLAGSLLLLGIPRGVGLFKATT